MNVMKQDDMDDKIIERGKTCEKQCMQEGLDRSRSCLGSIEQTEHFSMNRESIEKLSRMRWKEHKDLDR